jgi:hypothetical protein
MDKQELINLIKESYLYESEKDELIEYLENNEVDDKFYETFGQSLTKQFDIIVDRYKKLTGDYDNQADELDRHFEALKDKVKNERDQKLANIADQNPTDTETVWVWYDMEIDKLRKQQTQKLKKISEELLSI